MDYMILGLLLLCKRTIYQLRERIDKGMNLMYSSSMGSIQAAIKKLLHCGYIEYEKLIEHGRHKKVYNITESGKQHFLAWVNGPIEEQQHRCPELVKIYFFGFSDKGGREAAIQNYLSFLKEQYRILEALCEEAKHIEIPENDKDIFNYQRLSALYGKELYQFNIDWYEKILNQIRSGEL